MKKLLTILGLFLFLISPAPAHSGLLDNKTLEHGKSYTDYIISCNTKGNVMQHIRDVSQIPENQFTADNVMATIIDNDCTSQKQYFTYIDKEYVCGFSMRNNNFILLNTEVEGIKQYIIINNTIAPTDDVR